MKDENSFGDADMGILATTKIGYAERDEARQRPTNGLASGDGTAGGTGRSYVAYYRVSTKRQWHFGLSLDGQRADVLQHISKNPGRLIAEVTEVETGKNDDRLKLREAMRLCRVYAATLVVARLDRLSRSFALISSIMDSELDFVVADFPLANRFTIHILAAVAEYEVWLISQRVRSVHAAAKARGKKLSGPRREDWRTGAKAGNAASVVAQLKRARSRAFDLAPLVCDLRDQGKSIVAIAAELTRMEIAPPRGGSMWRPAVVRQIFFLSGEVPPSSAAANSRR